MILIADMMMIGIQDEQKKIYNQALMDLILKIEERKKLKGEA